ncbi:zinc ribbon domain-containing protein [Clostridium perfringens]|uniref:Zinc ribbon domain-containing protein n=1 Tax=Clostridium perfringens TaxID=1502 RepID=A0AAP4EE92_CLOPF|nr:zinc ribbon domain-containing protein [Clostridium perfringens]MDH2336797.1 zinc ribbon domain-containing protein [Clostridium perfringens]MDK0796506.1 zinc ribbon domain-containing protein [Clostridium perfringens]MDK0864041.1 zinc ribbon domain-containing protein [Clostridium perfringens]MDM0466762.1 zinc ribbon domain-containing protein [Clostridium perfringens]
MFFIGIFGVENKQKEIKQLDNIYCKTCSTRTMGTLIKSYEYFHIFFIPIFRWNEKYYVMCKRCNSIYEISKEKGKAIENGEINEVNLEDMTLIQEGQVYGKRAVKKVCPNCGKTVEGDYNYCPYCGSKI